MEGTNFTTVDGTLSSVGVLEGYVGDTNWTNYSVEFDLLDLGGSFSDTGLRVQLRRQDNSNYMVWKFNNNWRCTFTWSKIVEGKETPIANTKKDSPCKGRFKFEVSGNTYRMLVDGKQLLTFTDNTFGVGGAGLVSDRGDMKLILDNFRVIAVP